MLNKVILVGNLGKDPEVRHLESGSAVGKFSLATNESYKDKAGEWQTNTEWHNIVCWRNLAERAEKSLKKGSLIYLEGKLTSRKWQDQEGNDKYTTEVVANTFRLLEKREDSGGGYSNNFPAANDELPAGGNSVAPTQTAAKDFSEVKEEDDLPF